MDTIIQTEGLRKEFTLGGFPRSIKIQALNDVNISVTSQEPVIISVVGESGSGKTTLAKVILRLVQPTSGKVIVSNQLVAGAGAKPDKTEFLRTVQPIFQNPFSAFNRYRTIDTYLYETATRVLRLGPGEAVNAIEEALAAVGLEYKDVRGKYPNQFSGGELQRASVARALIPHPRLIIADEPVSMIDASRRMIIINLFLALKQEYNTSFLYITHDLATAYYISDYIAVLNRGRLVEFGEGKQVLQNPQHDYTRLLLSSIPSLDKKWTDEIDWTAPIGAASEKMALFKISGGFGNSVITHGTNRRTTFDDQSCPSLLFHASSSDADCRPIGYFTGHHFQAPQARPG